MTRSPAHTSFTQQAGAALMAGLTTLTLLLGMLGLADGYRHDGALLAQQPRDTVVAGAQWQAQATAPALPARRS